MRVVGVNNLFCAGEKSGLFVGQTEAISTGTIAGFEYFKRMKEMKLYTIDVEEINKRVSQLNLDNIFNVPLL